MSKKKDKRHKQNASMRSMLLGSLGVLVVATLLGVNSDIDGNLLKGDFKWEALDSIHIDDVLINDMPTAQGTTTIQKCEEAMITVRFKNTSAQGQDPWTAAQGISLGLRGSRNGTTATRIQIGPNQAIARDTVKKFLFPVIGRDGGIFLEMQLVLDRNGREQWFGDTVKRTIKIGSGNGKCPITPTSPSPAAKSPPVTTPASTPSVPPVAGGTGKYRILSCTDTDGTKLPLYNVSDGKHEMSEAYSPNGNTNADSNRYTNDAGKSFGRTYPGYIEILFEGPNGGQHTARIPDQARRQNPSNRGAIMILEMHCNTLGGEGQGGVGYDGCITSTSDKCIKRYSVLRNWKQNIVQAYNGIQFIDTLEEIEFMNLLFNYMFSNGKYVWMEAPNAAVQNFDDPLPRVRNGKIVY